MCLALKNCRRSFTTMRQDSLPRQTRSFLDRHGLQCDASKWTDAMSDLIPRLSLSQMPQTLAEMLKPRVQRLGYLGEFFQCAANQPEALICFQEFTEALKHALPDRLTEVVALTVAQLMENAYERVQHERLSLKLGFGESWVKGVLTWKCKRGIAFGIRGCRSAIGGSRDQAERPWHQTRARTRSNPAWP